MSPRKPFLVSPPYTLVLLFLLSFSASTLHISHLAGCRQLLTGHKGLYASSVDLGVCTKLGSERDLRRYILEFFKSKAGIKKKQPQNKTSLETLALVFCWSFFLSLPSQLPDSWRSFEVCLLPRVSDCCTALGSMVFARLITGRSACSPQAEDPLSLRGTRERGVGWGDQRPHALLGATGALSLRQEGC